MYRNLLKIFLITFFLTLSSPVKAVFDISPSDKAIKATQGETVKEYFTFINDSKNPKYKVSSLSDFEAWALDWGFIPGADGIDIFSVSFFVPKDMEAGNYVMSFDVDDVISSSQAHLDLSIEVLASKTEPEVFICFDSDDGLDYYITGITKNTAGWSRIDNCKNKTVLEEFYCEEGTGKVLFEGHACDNYCEGGRCIPENIVAERVKEGKESNKKETTALAHSNSRDNVIQVKKSKNVSSFFVFYNILLILFGLIIQKYTSSIQKTEGGVSLAQRMLGFVIVVVAALSMLVAFSIKNPTIIVLIFFGVIFKAIAMLTTSNTRHIKRNFVRSKTKNYYGKK